MALTRKEGKSFWKEESVVIFTFHLTSVSSVILPRGQFTLMTQLQQKQSNVGLKKHYFYRWRFSETKSQQGQLEQDKVTMIHPTIPDSKTIVPGVRCWDVWQQGARRTLGCAASPKAPTQSYCHQGKWRTILCCHFLRKESTDWHLTANSVNFYT